MTHTVASRPVPGGETWARTALSTLTHVPGVHRAGLALTEGGGRRLLFTANDRDNDDFVQWCEIDAYDDVPLTHTARTGQPVVSSRDELAVAYPAFADRQPAATVAVASVPIVGGGHVLGGYVLYFDTPQSFDAAQGEHLRQIGALLGSDLRQMQRATSHPSRSLASEPVPDGARVATYAVPHEPRAVAGARHFVETTLDDWDVDDSLIERAVLCLNELVTNALMHTDAGCQVRLTLDLEVLTTTVRDSGSAVVVDPSHVTTDPLAVHGRGLQLVAASATRWGSELDAGGMTVWCVLEPVPSTAGR